MSIESMQNIYGSNKVSVLAWEQKENGDGDPKKSENKKPKVDAVTGPDIPAQKEDKASNDEEHPWYSIYNWPGTGSSAHTMDELYAGNYLYAAGWFLVCAVEVFSFGSISEFNLGLNASRVTFNAAEGMTNAEVRVWYNTQLKALNTDVAFTERNAMTLSAERNALKVQARSMMADRQAAALLDKTDPIRSFEYYVQKYSSQGYSGESLWQRIIQGSSTPNPIVNKKFGL